MNLDLKILEDHFIRLQGSKITDFSYNNNVLRLQIATTLSNYLLPGSKNIHLVLQGCTYLYYISYSQTQENRIPIKNADEIFFKGLILQGIELSDRESDLLHTKEGFILYCSSYLNLVEAGELHLKSNGFQVYDQEFGRISYQDFCKASDLLKFSV